MATLSDSQSGAPGESVVATLTPDAGQTAFLDSLSIFWSSPALDGSPSITVAGVREDVPQEERSSAIDQKAGVADGLSHSYTSPLEASAPDTAITITVDAVEGGGAITVVATGHDESPAGEQDDSPPDESEGAPTPPVTAEGE